MFLTNEIEALMKVVGYRVVGQTYVLDYNKQPRGYVHENDQHLNDLDRLLTHISVSKFKCEALVVSIIVSAQ